MGTRHFLETREWEQDGQEQSDCPTFSYSAFPPFVAPSLPNVSHFYGATSSWTEQSFTVPCVYTDSYLNTNSYLKATLEKVEGTHKCISSTDFYSTLPKSAKVMQNKLTELPIPRQTSQTQKWKQTLRKATLSTGKVPSALSSTSNVCVVFANRITSTISSFRTESSLLFRATNSYLHLAYFLPCVLLCAS